MRLHSTFAAVVIAVIVLGTTSTASATSPGDNGEIAYLPHPAVAICRGHSAPCTRMTLMVGS